MNEINIKKAERRNLRFESLDDLVADAEGVLSVPHETTGNWNASQIVGHVTDLIAVANGHRTLHVPWPLRLAGRVAKRFGLLNRPIKPGFKAPGGVQQRVQEHAGKTPEQALAYLRSEAQHAENHAMTRPNPFFGRLTHDQWETLHCRHAELHFSFMRPCVD